MRLSVVCCFIFRFSGWLVLVFILGRAGWLEGAGIGFFSSPTCGRPDPGEQGSGGNPSGFGSDSVFAPEGRP